MLHRDDTAGRDAGDKATDKVTSTLCAVGRLGGACTNRVRGIDSSRTCAACQAEGKPSRMVEVYAVEKAEREARWAKERRS